MAENGSPVRRFFGYAAMTLGILTTFLSGACTLGGIGISVAGGFDAQMVGIALLIGAPAILVGVLLILLGRWLIRSATRPPDEVF